MELFSFEKLEVYQKSRILVVSVYNLINKFPKEEQFALCNQLRRCIVSVPSNIAEQSGRTYIKEKIHHIEYSYGSLMEAYCQLQIGVDLGYITENDFFKIKDQFFEISRLLSGLKKSLSSKL